MDLSHVYISSPWWWDLFILFAIVWPFVVLIRLPRRTTSPAVTAAAMVPLGAAIAVMWLSMRNVLMGAARSAGDVPTIAGLAEMFGALVFGFASAIAVLLFAAFKRHLPAADRTTVMLAIALFALFAAAVPHPLDWLPLTRVSLMVIVAMSIAALLVTLALCVHFARVERGQVITRALVPLAIGWVAVGLVAWWRFEYYAALAWPP